MIAAFRPGAGAQGHSQILQSLDERRQTIVMRWALANRGRVSVPTRDALNSALSSNVSVRGFSEESVPDAPPVMLIQSLRSAALVRDTVAQAALAVWQESKPELRETVWSAITEGRTGDAFGPADARLDDLQASLVAAHPQYQADDIWLMLALLLEDEEDGREEDERAGEDEGAGEEQLTETGADAEIQYLRGMVEALQRENERLRAAQSISHTVEIPETAEPPALVPPDFQDVASVLEFVETRWPSQLKLALNRASDPHTYFDQPSQLYSALEWLATTYRDARTGEKTVTNLDVSLFTTCGWRYRPSQPDSVPGRYKADYQTIDDGTTYILREHIGRGTGRVAGQIRVAFVWDEEREIVIVGYVGRHQRGVGER